MRKRRRVGKGRGSSYIYGVMSKLLLEDGREQSAGEESLHGCSSLSLFQLCRLEKKSGGVRYPVGLRGPDGIGATRE